MTQCPDKVGDMKVVMFTPIDERHAFTGNCKQIVAGQVLGPMAGLVICQHQGGYYLFGCDDDWSVNCDTWHDTLADAIDQAEYEYTGTRGTWVGK